MSCENSLQAAAAAGGKAARLLSVRSGSWLGGGSGSGRQGDANVSAQSSLAWKCMGGGLYTSPWSYICYQRAHAERVMNVPQLLCVSAMASVIIAKIWLTASPAVASLECQWCGVSWGLLRMLD